MTATHAAGEVWKNVAQGPPGPTSIEPHEHWASPEQRDDGTFRHAKELLDSCQQRRKTLGRTRDWVTSRQVSVFSYCVNVAFSSSPFSHGAPRAGEWRFERSLTLYRAYYVCQRPRTGPLTEKLRPSYSGAPFSAVLPLR